MAINDQLGRGWEACRVSVPSHFGRYRVLRPLATGEMGVVYLAEDPLIGRRLAIKGIRFDVYSDDDEIQRLQARFDQEIQIAGTFSHPNIVTLYDVGHEGGRSFIAMEFVDGRNLRAELQANGPMSATRAVELIAPVGHALTYAHERKVIHRDIKPTNILVSSEGVPKITDFDVARLFGSTLTNAGKIFGTPAYMSPEQARGTKLSGASDQFAVAAVLYELLTGERPFKGTSPTAVIYEVIENEPLPPHELAPLVPTGVSDVVMRGLAKEPEDRFESCAAFSEALEGAVAWARANPDLAYFQPEEQAPPAPQAAPLTVTAWTERLDEMRDRARRAATAAAGSDVWSDVRSMASRILSDTRNLTAFVIGTMSLVILLTVVAWAASSSQPVAELTPRTKQAELLAASQRANRGVPAADVATGRSNNSSAATKIEERETPADEALIDAPDVTVGGIRTFVVGTRPRGARVTLDGDLIADTSPVTIEVDTSNPHTLIMELEGYAPVTWGFSHDSLSTGHLESGELFFPLRALPPAEAEAEADAETTPAETIEPSEPSPDTRETPVANEPSGYGVAGPPPSPADIRRVRAPSQAPTPERLRHVELELPATASSQGVIVMEIEVSARGNVVQAKVLRGLDPLSNQAALNAVVRWKYRPTAVAGEPVHVIMTVSVPIGQSDGRR